MVKLKDPKPPPYVPRVDEDGKEETTVSLLGKTVKFEQQTGDDEGLVREFNPKTGMCKVQLFSGKIVRIMRTEFETVENLIKKRQKRARDAISEKYAQAEADSKMLEDGSIVDNFDERTVTSAITGSIAMDEGNEALEEANGRSIVSPSQYSSTYGGVKGNCSNELVLRGLMGEDDVSVNEENEMGMAGKDFLGGDTRYASIANKYDKFRALLAGAKADRAVRRPGKSALDDYENMGSDDKTIVTTAKSGKESPMPQLLGRYGKGDDDSSLGTNKSNKTLWSFGSIQHKFMKESTDILIISKYKKKRERVKDRNTLKQEALYNKFQGFGTISSPPNASLAQSSISTVPSKINETEVQSGNGEQQSIMNKCIFPGEEEEGNVVPCSPYVSTAKSSTPQRTPNKSRQNGALTPSSNTTPGSEKQMSPVIRKHSGGGSGQRGGTGVAFSTVNTKQGKVRSSSPYHEEPYSATPSMGGRGAGFGGGGSLSMPISDWGGEVSPKLINNDEGVNPDLDFENNNIKSQSQGEHINASYDNDDEYNDDYYDDNDEDYDDEDAYDYVFPIIIERRGDGQMVTRWAPGSNVEIALNKGDDFHSVAVEFAIKFELPHGVADSIQEFLEKTISVDPSAAFEREIVYQDPFPMEEESDLESEEEALTPRTIKSSKMTGAELDRIEAEEKAKVEAAARRPAPEGGTPLRHPKRHEVYGANVPAHVLKQDDANDVDMYEVDQKDGRASSRLNSRGGGSRGQSRGASRGTSRGTTPKTAKREATSRNSSRNNGGVDVENSENEASNNQDKKVLFTPDTAFMVMAVLRKGRKDPDRVALALKTVLTDISPTKEGCFLLVKHKVLELICDVSELHWMDVKIQVLSCLVLRNLLVGHVPIRRNERLLKELRAHMKRLVSVKQVVESCIDAFRIMATESCKIANFDDTIVKDLTIFDFVLAVASSSERVGHADIVHPALRYLSLVIGLRQRPACKQLVIGNGIYFALSCLQIHSDNSALMSAALRLLVLAAKIDGDVTTGGPSPNHGVAVAVGKVRLPPQHKSSKAALKSMKQQYSAKELKRRKEEGLKKFKEDVESQGVSIGGPKSPKSEAGESSRKEDSQSKDSSEEVEEDDRSLYSFLSKSTILEKKSALDEVDDDDIDAEHDIGQVHPVEVILHTMMRLHSDSKLQLGGTELIQTLIQNEDAKKVLDKIPGGLDWLCQGPDEGNVLIHWREGHLKNKGWAYGEQKYHTGTAGEYLWDGTQAMASLDRSLAHLKFGDSIEADVFGIPTKHSVHAHQELASMHHVVREYDQSEYHYEQALKKTEEAILRAKDDLFCQETTVKAAQASGTDILPPIHIKNTRGSNNNTSTNAGIRGGGDGVTSTMIKLNREQNESSGKTVMDDDRTVVGALNRKVFHFNDGEGGVLRERLHRAQQELQAALVRKEVILSNRNMMRRDRENGAEFSQRLELWTPASLQPYLPASHQPVNHVKHSRASDYVLEPPPSSIWSSYAAQPFHPVGKIADESTTAGSAGKGTGLMKEPIPLKLPAIEGTSQPPRWETFTDDSLRAHFAVYKRLALLPYYGESKEEWRKRMKFWERESGTTVAQLAMVEREKDFPGLFPM